VNGQDPTAEIFDVFLCHNSVDKPAVRQIAQKLVKAGIKPWLDEDQIRPGASWQTTLGEQIESIKSAAVFLGDGGLGPWQDQEMQSFLNRFVNQKCAVIPVILSSTKSTPKLPWPLANLHCVDFRTDSHPLQRLIWGITGQKPAELSNLLTSDKPATMQEAAKPRLIEGGRELAPQEKVSPLSDPPDPDNVAQLNILRKRVMEYWVDGVLKHSLRNEVLISLAKRKSAKAIDAPWKYIVDGSDATNSTPLDYRNISAIYDATGSLLILGEPGGGKTTTLLDLARTLLERAKDDIKERVPVVLNLSSWKKEPIAEWISNDLSEKYRVPRKIARFWLQRGYLLPLLDGLDEIETSIQPDCVTAINTFIEELRPSGLVVCCRLNEYRWLPKRLKLNGAIRLEPLSPEEVSAYLAAGGTSPVALREAVDADPVLSELAQTPLMLSIMSLAYQGAGRNELAIQRGASPEARRKQIFGLYVEQMFQRKGMDSLSFPKEKIIGWLSWLAEKMREDSQSVFLVEGLQPSWLGSSKRVAYRMIVVLSVGLISGLSYGLNSWPSDGLSYGLIWGSIFGSIVFTGVALGGRSKSPVQNGIVTGLIIGLILWLIRGLIPGHASGSIDGPMRGLIPGHDGPISGLIPGLSSGLVGGLIGGIGVGSLNHIILIETMSWKWNRYWIPGLVAGAIIGLVLWCLGGRSDELISGLNLGLTFALIGAVTIGWICGFIDNVKVDKESPNQGIRLSRENSLTAFLVACLIYGLCYVPFSLWTSPHLSKQISAMGFGLTLVIICALNRGGSAVIKHYALRLTLWLSGNTPFNFIKFLDHCAKLILLKKVGGGYIFIHRMLLDYFADLPQSTKDGDGKTESVQS
jgi:hypothetical protein